MQMAGLENYETGGSIHVICNNQVGFTTDPEHGRSTKYASDLGKAFEAPIFHVNGDDTEEVVRVFEIAAQWRQAFSTDVVIDVIGYRRHGHNEIDQPLFTQPQVRLLRFVSFLVRSFYLFMFVCSLCMFLPPSSSSSSSSLFVCRCTRTSQSTERR